MVVEDLCIGRPETVEQGQWPEAVRLVEVAAVLAMGVFGDELVALPEKLGGLARHGFADAPAKRVVAIAGLAAVRLVMPIRRCWQS